MDLINQNVKKHPKKIAIQYKSKTISYQTLDTNIEKIAHYLSNEINEKRIGIKVPNPLDAIYCIWGALRAGKTIYILNHHYKTYTTDLIKQYNLKFILKTYPNIPQTPNSSIINKTSQSSIRIFTTGSTGTPKCVIHSINTLGKSAAAINKALSYRKNDIWHCQLPFYHVSGLAILWRTLLAGATIQLQTTNKTYTHISCIEKQLENILKKPPTHPIKCILIGGSSITKKTLLKAIQRNLPIYQSYGLTETGSACTLSPLSKKTLNLSGIPLAHINVTIINKLIHVKGPSCCLGFETPTTTTLLNKNNYYNTLDYGTLTPSKHLKVLGRSNRMIIIKGENIQLENIETMVQSLDNIKHFYIIPITKNENQLLYGFVELKKKQHDYKRYINNAIKTYFSSLCIPQNILLHEFKTPNKISYLDIKKHID